MVRCYHRVVIALCFFSLMPSSAYATETKTKPHRPVPIDKAIIDLTTLEKTASRPKPPNSTNPKARSKTNAAPELNFLLGRLHILAYADTKTIVYSAKTKLPIFSSREPVIPEFRKAGYSREHVDKAFYHFKRALDGGYEPIRARLGMAWSIHMAGHKDSAAKEYRRVVAEAWPMEVGLKRTERYLSYPSALEAAEHLIVLLNHARDGSEITDLKTKIKLLKARKPRAPRPSLPAR